MPREIEIKVRTRDAAALRARLKRCGAAYVGRVLEVNHIYDSNDGALRAAGVGLRVRTTTDLAGDGQSSQAGVLTYKGKRAAGGLKNREELETRVDSANGLGAASTRIGAASRS